MARTITFTDITMDRAYRIVQDPETGEVFAHISGTFVNAEGFTLKASTRIGPLTGTPLNRAASLFSDLKDLYKLQEGI